jgi:hypothetical protein
VRGRKPASFCFALRDAHACLAWGQGTTYIATRNVDQEEARGVLTAALISSDFFQRPAGATDQRLSYFYVAMASLTPTHIAPLTVMWRLGWL